MSKRRNRMNKKGRKFLKDKTLVKFILQHSVKEEIALSKVEITSFKDILKVEEEDSRSFRAKFCKSNPEEPNIEKFQNYPTFRLPLLDIIKMEENFVPLVHFSNSLFQANK